MVHPEYFNSMLIPLRAWFKTSTSLHFHFACTLANVSICAITLCSTLISTYQVIILHFRAYLAVLNTLRCFPACDLATAEEIENLFPY